MADYLESIDLTLCIKFIEYLFGERQEESKAFGNRLAELYLRSTVQYKKAKSPGELGRAMSSSIDAAERAGRSED